MDAEPQPIEITFKYAEQREVSVKLSELCRNHALEVLTACAEIQRDVKAHNQGCSTQKSAGVRLTKAILEANKEHIHLT